MKIVTVIGARPQFIKASTVSRILSLNKISEVIIHTGQHYDKDMSAIFFNELEISEPQYNLSIGGGSHGENTGRMIEEIEKALLKESPDYVLVYGDTDSTLAGAISAIKLHIPLAHVEAGLRSFNKTMPEEHNRILTDHASNILFVPTDTAKDNLMNEGIDEESIHYVGDVMYDASIYFGEKSEKTSSVLNRLKLKPKNYILTTIHRAENTNNSERLECIINGIGMLDENVVLPLHPRTKAILNECSIKIPDNLILIPPVGYLDMIMLEKNAMLIATDSGGVQKEAFFYAVPCVTLRDETEWIELVDSGWNRIASPGQSASHIAKVINNMIGKQGDDINPYGSGDAAEKIVNTLLDNRLDASS